MVLTLATALAVVWLAGAVATVLIVSNQLEQTLDGGLRETAERILPLVTDSMGDTDGGDLDGYRKGMSDPEGGEYVVYQVRDIAGSVVMRSHDAPDVPFTASLTPGFSTAQPWRIYTTGDGQLFVQVAEDQGHRSEALWRTAGAIALPLALLIPLTAIIIFASVRRGLWPLRELDAEVSARDAANLTPLAQRLAPAELVPMRRAIDALLARLRLSFDAERALAANSAHELRTPIAGSLAQTQRLVEELDGHPAQVRARWVHETLQRLALLAAKLLELSKADSGAALLPAPIDLLPAARMMISEARRGLGSRLTTDIDPNARLFGRLDIDAFGIVVRNLLENAERHGLSSDPVHIGIGDNVLEVTSAGPIVAPAILALLGRRFERGTATAPGSGLGLAIVSSVMQQVGGRLELLSPGTGRTDGFTARIVFP